jgi:hypothetical protein
LEELEGRVVPSASVLQFHNDHAATGQNLNETILTPANVNSATFGKLGTTPVDGQVYAQPLYVPNVNVTVGTSQGLHNVVYVATEHDSLYAIDADNGAVLWKDSFLSGRPGATITPVPAGDVGDTASISPEIGITSTPVIDPGSNTLFLTAKTKEVAGDGVHYVYRLHAIDLSSGAEKFGGPAAIADTILGPTDYVYVSGPTVHGTGDGSIDGNVTFNALRQLQRTGLVLVNGIVYFAFASHGDVDPYHGWVLGYDARTLGLAAAFNDTPNGEKGGIWQSGGALSADSQGNLYLITGNGTFDTTLGAGGFPVNGDYGDSFVKLAPDPTTTPLMQGVNGWGLKVVDYFTPHDQDILQIADLDLGSTGAVLLPDSVGSAAHRHLLVGAGKEGRIYLIDRDNMGKFDPNTDHIVQEAPQFGFGFYDVSAYFNGTVYYVGNGVVARAFSIANGVLSDDPTSISNEVYGYPGATPSVSANGTANGIVWQLDRATNVLFAYDASSYGTLLYASNQAGDRDQLGRVVKFTTPTIADGHVLVGTANSLVRYGLFAHQEVPAVTAVSPPSGPAAGGTLVTVTGSGFTGATDVFFGSTAAAFTVVSDTQLTATAPAHAVGIIDVTVRNPVGTSAASAADQYTFVPPLDRMNSPVNFVLTADGSLWQHDLAFDPSLPPDALDAHWRKLSSGTFASFSAVTDPNTGRSVVFAIIRFDHSLWVHDLTFDPALSADFLNAHWRELSSGAFASVNAAYDSSGSNPGPVAFGLLQGGSLWEHDLNFDPSASAEALNVHWRLLSSGAFDSITVASDSTGISAGAPAVFGILRGTGQLWEHDLNFDPSVPAEALNVHWRLLSSGAFDSISAANTAAGANLRPVVFGIIKWDHSLWQHDLTFDPELSADFLNAHWRRLSSGAFASVSATIDQGSGNPVVFAIIQANHSLWVHDLTFDPALPADFLNAHWRELSSGAFASVSASYEHSQTYSGPVVSGTLLDGELFLHDLTFDPSLPADALNVHWRRLSSGRIIANTMA